MASIYDVDASELITKVAEKLKEFNTIKPPEWADYVKTGVHKERPPAIKDWWYIRAAAILRTVSRFGPIGVSKLRTRYGGKKNRGHKAERFCKGSGNIARKVLQQLEKSELLKQEVKNVHKGRVITPKGQSILDKSATEVQKNQPKEAPKVEVKKEEAKPEIKEAKPKVAPKVEVKKEEAKPEVKEVPKKVEVKDTPKVEVKKEDK